MIDSSVRGTTVPLVKDDTRYNQTLQQSLAKLQEFILYVSDRGVRLHLERVLLESRPGCDAEKMVHDALKDVIGQNYVKLACLTVIDIWHAAASFKFLSELAVSLPESILPRELVPSNDETDAALALFRSAKRAEALRIASNR